MEESPVEPGIPTSKEHIAPGPDKLVKMVDRLFRYEPLAEPASSIGLKAAERANPQLARNKADKFQPKEQKKSSDAQETSPELEKKLEDLPESHFDRHEVMNQEQEPGPSVSGSGMTTVGQVLTSKGAPRPPATAPPLLPPANPNGYWQEPSRSTSPIYMYRKPLMYGIFAGIAASVMVIIMYFR